MIGIGPFGSSRKAPKLIAEAVQEMQADVSI
jgi:hypothetical protein